MKTNALVDPDVLWQVKELLHKMEREYLEHKRTSRGRGRREGEANLIGHIFERALREHPEWIDEWYREGLVDKAASHYEIETHEPDYKNMAHVKGRSTRKRRGTNPGEEASSQ